MLETRSVTLPNSVTAPCIYVHLISGDVEELRPADNVRVIIDSIEVRDGEEVVASYAAREVLFCSHIDVPPFPFS